MERNTTTLKILKSAVEASFGLVIFAAGIYLTIQAGIGAAPWDIFCLGLSKQTGFLYGTCSIIISGSILLIDGLILKEQIGLGMIINTLVIAKTIDVLNYFDPVKTPDSLIVSILMMLVGFLLEGYGQFLYIRVALGCGPRDAFQMGIGKRMPKVPIGVVNIMILAVVFCIGWALGGPIGIGSLIAPVGMGLMQQLAFNSVKFEPKSVKHQNFFESLKVFAGKKE